MLTPRVCGAAFFLSSANHSCDPNVAFDLVKGHVYAIKRIEAGDEGKQLLQRTHQNLHSLSHVCVLTNNCFDALTPSDILLSEHRMVDGPAI